MKVIIEGDGVYEIPNDYLMELKKWLQDRRGVAIKNESTDYQGKQLILD